MIGLFFIATAWGRNNGGINSINTALLKNLSAVVPSDWQLFCVVTQGTGDADVAEEVQDKYKVTLFRTTNPIKSRRLKRELTQKQFDQVFFIGHDAITGDYASKLRDVYPQNAVSVIFHHMDYGKYYYLRTNNPGKIRAKIDEQRSILSEADIIIPIGPLLTKSAQDFRKDARKEDKIKIHEITPGMENIVPIPGVHNNHKVILFGRLEDENNAVKQVALAIDALGKYLSTHEDEEINITCYGYTDDSVINQKKLMEEIQEFARKTISITANSYITDEKTLFDELASASLCIMPSIYEGFGLTGYEAISAGVPVIISENTGLFKFLEGWKGNSVQGLFKSIKISGGISQTEKPYREDDLTALTKCIEDVFYNYEKHKERAMELRKILWDAKCTWDYSARAFTEIIKGEINTYTPNALSEDRARSYQKEFIGFKEYIVEYLMPEFCSMLCDIDKLVCKVIKYSNDRNRRFTIFSSDEFNKTTDNRLRIRGINDGTVGVLNYICSKKGESTFPVIVSNFTCGQCILISDVSEYEILENQSLGVPDHQVLAIMAVPLIYKNNLVGALTLDIYDQAFIQKFENKDSEIMNVIYINMKHFSAILTSQFYTDINDDLNFSEVRKMIRRREIISFSGRCPLNCKHCFAKEVVDKDEPENDIDAVVNELRGKLFDVVYVSHYKENFFVPDQGVELCEKIYGKYKCDIFVTTRCTLTGEPLARIKALDSRMKKSGNSLAFCISIPALESYTKIENPEFIATPAQRIDFAGQLKAARITTFVTIRPLFPSSFITENEIHQIVDRCVGKVDGILTGGLYATDNILDNLQIPHDKVTYLDDEKSEYLVGVEQKFHAIDVEKEMQGLEAYCKSKSLPFFRHSMEALNYFRIY